MQERVLCDSKMGFWIAVAVIAFVVIAAPIGGFAILFYCFPHILIRQFMRYQAFCSGMTIKFVGIGENVFCYGEKNKPQPNKVSIVFIHGFTSSKDQWISCFKGLPADIHMIAVDLPGHGESSPDEDSDLSFETATDQVNEFLNLVLPEDVKVHMVGNSFGGAIAGLFAAKYPDRLERLSLVCPAMLTPVDTELQLQIKSVTKRSADSVTYDDFQLLAKNLQEIKDMLVSICFNKNVAKLHNQIFKGVLTLRLPKLPYYLKLFSSLAKTSNLDYLERKAPEITIPSQVIWGKNDEVLDVSGSDILQTKLGDCRHVDIIDQCGHAIHLDRPGSLIKHILKFYEEGQNRKDN